MGGSSSKPKPYVWPNKQPTINAKNREIGRLNRGINNEIAKANSTRNKISRTINDRNWHNKVKRDYQADDPRKRADLAMEEGTVAYLNSRIGEENVNISNIDKSLQETKSLLYTSVLTNVKTIKEVGEIIDDTKKQNMNIYAGMNQTNNSLKNNIRTLSTSHTTDVSQVAYQTQQTDYFSQLNIILISVYGLLFLLYAYLVYKTKYDINIRIKLLTLVSLVIFPYISLLYYNIYI